MRNALMIIFIVISLGCLGNWCAGVEPFKKSMYDMIFWAMAAYIVYPKKICRALRSAK